MSTCLIDKSSSQVCQCFLDGYFEFNDHASHVGVWYTHRQQPNILFLLYEDLKENLEREILKIADFLGEEYLMQMRSNENALLKKVVEGASFQSMAKHKNSAWVRYSVLLGKSVSCTTFP